MADFTSTISSTGVGTDYTDIASWEAARQTARSGTIPSGDIEYLEFWDMVPHTAENFVTGWTFTDATSRMQFYPKDGTKHTGKPGTGSGASMTGASGSLIRTDSTAGMNLDIVGLELELVHATNGSAQLIMQITSGPTMDSTIDSCFIHSSGGGTPHAVSLVLPNSSPKSLHVFNTVVIGFSRQITNASQHTAALAIDFCTLYDGSQYGSLYPTAQNTIAMSNGFNDFFTPQAGSDYNVSSDASATGTNSVTGKTTYTDYFTDPANDDLSLKDTTSAAGIFGQAGTPVSGITVDILGNTRDATNPDIGAFEYAPAVVTPVVTNVVADPTNPAKGATFELSADLDTIGETIIAAEWWTGSDLGPGNNNAMDLGAGTTSREATDTVDTTSLALGSNVFWVRGESASGWGDDVSVAVSVIVPTPQNVAAEGGDEKVTVTWDDVDYNDSYVLFWDTSSPVTIPGSNQIAVAGADTTSYEHTGRTNGVEYFYAVRAIAAAAASLLSAEVSAEAGAPASGDNSGLNLGLGLGL